MTQTSNPAFIQKLQNTMYTYCKAHIPTNLSHQQLT